MNELQAMALATFRSQAQAAVKSGKRSLALYDELERRLRAYRDLAVWVCAPTRAQRCQMRIDASDLALSLVDYKRRKYMRRMGDRLFDAPQRVPERGTG